MSDDKHGASIGPILLMAGIGSAMLAGKVMFDTAVRVHRAGRPARMLMGAAPFAMAGWMMSTMGARDKVSVLPAEGGAAPVRKRPVAAAEAEVVAEPAPVFEAALEAQAPEAVAAAMSEPLAVEANSIFEAIEESEPDTDEFVAEILAEPQPPQAEAPVAAERPTALGMPRAAGADDLKRIKGIGPKLEIELNALGYYHFDQIAAWGPAELAWVDENLQGFTGRATRDDWIGQARVLAGGNLPD